MGVYAGPDVRESGLVLALDAGNIKSYDKYENLLNYSEQFDNAAWGKQSTSVSANATAAPDGTLTADNVTNTPNSGSYLSQVKSGLSTTTTYTASVYVKPLTTNKVVALEWGGAWTSFNLSNLTTTGGGGTGKITVLDSGWYRISHTVTNVTSFNVIYIGAYGTTADTVTVALWGAQLEISSTVSDYYATAASTKSRGTTLTNLVGSGTGTLTSGPTYNSSNGGALVFDGTDDYVNCGAINISSGTSLTVSVWVNPGTSQKAYADILDYDHGNLGFVIQQNNTALNQYYFAYWNGASYDITSNAILTTSSYNHLVFTKSGTSVVGYINGQNAVNYTGSSTITLTGKTLYVGRLVSGTGREFNGNISSVQIYNRALTAAEVSQNFNATKSRYGL